MRRLLLSPVLVIGRCSYRDENIAHNSQLTWITSQGVRNCACIYTLGLNPAACVPGFISPTIYIYIYIFQSIVLAFHCKKLSRIRYCKRFRDYSKSRVQYYRVLFEKTRGQKELLAMVSPFLSDVHVFFTVFRYLYMLHSYTLFGQKFGTIFPIVLSNLFTWLYIKKNQIKFIHFVSARIESKIEAQM